MINRRKYRGREGCGWMASKADITAFGSAVKVFVRMRTLGA